MRKKRAGSVILTIAMAAAFTVTACSSNKDSANKGVVQESGNSGSSAGAAVSSSDGWQTVDGSTDGEADQSTSGQASAADAVQTPLEVPEGQYLSELTGLPIDEDLRMQRPIAVMVDNESTALPHYGTADADIVYELMNSTANDRITRLMCIYKDWDNLDQVGSIRSTRPTNILLAQEYYAVICHDGGPYYIDSWLEKYPWHFSGTFSRVNNGKAREFTEYILPGDLDRNFADSGYSKEYSGDYLEEKQKEAKKAGESESGSGDSNAAAPVSLFRFAEYGTTVDLDEEDADGVRTANNIVLPFPHNQSRLVYNEETKTYDYYEYGEQHSDAETGEPLSFTNVLLQNCTFSQLDQNGYLIYNCISGYELCYYCTGGKNISCLWAKTGEGERTRYYDVNHHEITINPGKTYVSLIPSDSFDQVQIY